MRTPIYQVDAFSNVVFRGNPAAVCPLERWPDDATLQAIAAENNLAETAFFVPRAGEFDLRWFTPTIEIDLCGHATLASGWVVFHRLEPARERVTFHTRSGALTVAREGGRLRMDLPSRPATPCATPAGLIEALGATPREVLRSIRDVMAVFDTEAEVAALAPRMDALAALDVIGTIATAPGTDVDFVSRFFAPRAGVAEDPVTGSAHCTLAPYWSARLGRTRTRARQISARTGEIDCELGDAIVTLRGDATLYLEGTIEV